MTSAPRAGGARGRRPAPGLTIEPCVIGRVHSAFTAAEGTPVQPPYAPEAEGRVVIDEAFEDALDDIDGFDRIWLIYWMDSVRAFRPRVVPYRDDVERGLFATRAPARPNPIGISSVRLLRRECRELFVSELDILDGTPLLDIKPYVPEFDSYPEAKAGWLDQCGEARQVADGRFHGSVEAVDVEEARPSECGCAPRGLEKRRR